mmetsp:Transcript_9576/g.19973  ORF Transcript_9576/g.19973 Transcript_9576/m.19973 type:complete len:271 (+) Transcript_9576:859-1671(+)
MATHDLHLGMGFGPLFAEQDLTPLGVGVGKLTIVLASACPCSILPLRKGRVVHATAAYHNQSRIHCCFQTWHGQLSQQVGAKEEMCRKGHFHLFGGHRLGVCEGTCIADQAVQAYAISAFFHSMRAKLIPTSADICLEAAVCQKNMDSAGGVSCCCGQNFLSSSFCAILAAAHHVECSTFRCQELCDLLPNARVGTCHNEDLSLEIQGCQQVRLGIVGFVHLPAAAGEMSLAIEKELCGCSKLPETHGLRLDVKHPGSDAKRLAPDGLNR